MRRIALLALAAILGCQMVRASEKFVTQTFALSSGFIEKMEFKLPTRQSKDFPKTEPVHYVDLAEVPASESKIILKNYYDFGRGLWLLSPKGTLGVAIRVVWEKGADLSSAQDLKDYYVRQFERNNRAVLESYLGSVGETAFAKFSLGGRPNSSVYLIPVSRNSCVQVLFSYIGNSDDQTWRAEAVALERQVIDSIVITPSTSAGSETK